MLRISILHLSCNAVRGIYAILRMANNNPLKCKVGSVYHLSLDTLKIMFLTRLFVAKQYIMDLHSLSHCKIYNNITFNRTDFRLFVNGL